MATQKLLDGVVHVLPKDLQQELASNDEAARVWQSLTPLARNEWICWTESAKQEATRARRIRIAGENLSEGQRRPCCWPGCPHRADRVVPVYRAVKKTKSVRSPQKRG